MTALAAMKQALEFLEGGNFVYPTELRNNLRAAIEQMEKAEPCVWTLDNTDCFYHTSCGNSFVLNDGTPTENDMKFCPYCSKTIKEEVEPPWEEDEEGEK